MLIIRKDQMNAFQEKFDDAYINRIMPILKEDYPDECNALGNEKVYELAKYGLNRSEHYGITTEANVYCFIQMIILFGRNFDVDSDLSWASDVLNDPSLQDENERIDYLCEEASEYIEKMENQSEYQGNSIN